MRKLHWTQVFKSRYLKCPHELDCGWYVEITAGMSRTTFILITKHGFSSIVRGTRSREVPRTQLYACAETALLKSARALEFVLLSAGACCVLHTNAKLGEDFFEDFPLNLVSFHFTGIRNYNPSIVIFSDRNHNRLTCQQSSRKTYLLQLESLFY